MSSVLSILNELAATSKRLEKEAILKREFDNQQLKQVFWAAYNPDITYWIQKHPKVESFQNKNITINSALQVLLDTIAARQITGNAAIEQYRTLLSQLTPDDGEVLRRIIDRDLRCGVSTPTVNKIWKGLIPTYQLMLAESKPDHLKFPDVVVQLKYDGLRCLVTHTHSNEIIMRTRNGNQITSLEIMHHDFKKVIPNGQTWDGELVCYEGDSPLSRKISNGILNKAIRETISVEEASKVRFLCWDTVDQTQSIPYHERLKGLYLALKQSDNVKTIKAVETHKVSTLAEVDALFQKALNDGHEGVIAKNLNAVWQPKRSGDLCKFKAELTADLIVVKWEEGLGRNKGRLGALVCESSDGKIRVNIGSGFSDLQRDSLTPENTIDKIVEVIYNARISKKNGEIDSLYLPRFKQFRNFEKTVADSSNEIK